MKKLLMCAAVAIAAPAQAGFVTGVVAGSVLASSSAEQRQGRGFFIASDKHDVIICHKEVYDMKCSVPGPTLTPAQYAASQGYKILHKVSVLITPRHDYIVMEVSK